MCDGAIVVGCIVFCFLIFLAGLTIYEVYFETKTGTLRIVELENGKFAVEEWDFVGYDNTGYSTWVRKKEFKTLKQAQEYKDSITPKAETKIKRVIK